MRLWTLHPRWLDAQGLVALWREALLAQKVLAGETRGYRQHPQLARFRAHREPNAAIATYLYGVADEALLRGYDFDLSRIREPRRRLTLQATTGQLRFERAHLLAKLAVRDPERVPALERARPLAAHPMFRVQPGPVAEWERGNLE
ncbi:MAG: pyrimidine dimer DNA glycosylase/endonuclease V [Proteobacteria bacterium]|nr:pyrimidine dimer DNA glycosylase/endonuclease V [Pseudomonadota bacterium]